MQVEKVSEEGLKKVFLVTQTSENNKQNIETYILDKAKTVKIDGFRPGKAPLEKVRSYYQRQAFSQVISDLIENAEKEIRNQIPEGICVGPEIEGEPSFENEAFEATFVAYGKPIFDLCDLSTIDVNDYQFLVDESEVLQKMESIAASHESKEVYPDDHVSQENDRVVIKLASVYGKNKLVKGYNTKRASLTIDAANEEQAFLINQLRGRKKGDEIKFTETFASNCADTRLSSKVVHFSAEILEICHQVKLPLGEELAQKLEFESLEKWKEKVAKDAHQHYETFSNLCKRRTLLDALSEKHIFDVPEMMVENEFKNIWSQLEEEEKNGGAEGKTSEEVEEECRKLANRRVRLGFVVTKLSEALNVKVYEKDYENAVWREAMRSFDRYGWESFKIVSKYYQENQQAHNQLISVILEEKTVTALLERVTSIPVQVSLEELKKKVDEVLPDFWQEFNAEHNHEEDTCDHHEGCGHQH